MLRRSMRHRINLHYSPKRFLTYIPHAFSTSDALAKFNSVDAKRFFAPIVFKKDELASFKGNPLKKVLIPCFGVNTQISHTSYSGEYGIDRTVYDYHTTTDSDGNTTTTTTTRTETDWYDIDGSVGSAHYTPEDRDMTIYGGFTWKASQIERALNGYTFVNNLQSFDASLLDKETHIDPFLKRSAVAQEDANKRIRSEEEGRIHADIEKQSGYSKTRVNHFNIHYTYSELKPYLLPAYILQYEGHAPRILPAITSDDKIIFGPKQYSVTKCSIAGGAVATAGVFIAGVFFPQIAVPLRTLKWIGAGASLASGLWAKYQGGTLQYTLQEWGINRAIQNNESVSETIADKNRFHATSRNFPKPEEQPLLLDAEFYETLGLDPNAKVTKEMVVEAFNTKIKEAHPDKKTGNTEQTRKLIAAKKEFNRVLNNNVPKRGFATSIPKRQAIKVPPRSVYDPNAHELITKVIDQKDYANALVLVQEGKVIPDGHDKGENTLITEIAKRGSVQDLRFAIDKLGCSVDTSCDCPVHNTALHYGSMRGDKGIVQELLKRKATVNLINSRGQTALDVAGNAETQKVLINHGGVKHTTVEGSAGLFRRFKGATIGYSPDQRTLISANEKPLPKLGK